MNAERARRKAFDLCLATIEERFTEMEGRWVVDFKDSEPSRCMCRIGMLANENDKKSFRFGDNAFRIYAVTEADMRSGRASLTELRSTLPPKPVRVEMP